MNFYELLNEELNTTLNNDICLITQETLLDNYITLKCGHKFNYLPLYNEVVKQKIVPSSLETIRVKVNEIKCPYCRTITPNIMPFIDISGVKLIKGVNYPKKYCLIIHKCDWVYKFGKNKGTCCNKPAIKTENGILCKTHLNKYLSKNENLEKTKNYGFDIKNYKNYTIKELKNILKNMNLKVSGTKSDLIERLLQKNYNFIK
tara:strand:- start:471 stop:1079 length:609 start_codon:yes stop_codon:yes gene_type:complete